MTTRTGVEVKLSGVHLCCQGCTDAADAALRSVAGVDSHCDMDDQTVTLRAGDASAAREALDALALAGFYGVSNNPDLAMKPVGVVPSGKATRVKVSGIHNCCEPCYWAIEGAITAVEGVTGDRAEPGATSFEVTGDFHPAELVQRLNAAGFSARVT